MTPKHILSIVGTVFGIILLIVGFNTVVGHNNAEDWQIIQSVDGDISVRDEPGFYYKGAAHVTTYPRVFSIEWGPDTVTFNDGGTAKMAGIMRIRTPATTEQRLKMHMEFGGDSTMRNAETSVESHLVNVLQVTGPVMSGSEHQSARKGEFYNLAYEQLENGLYQSERIQVELTDQLDQGGKPIKVFATKIIKGHSGDPIIQEASPLIQYGFGIAQFSIETTEYDQKTLDLFAAKKESLLNAERSKAAREEQVQERLMIVERGLKERAEVEAQANKEKARLTIEGETRVAVASQSALQTEELKKQETTQAETRRIVAELDLESQKLAAESIRVKAAAEQERIAKAGAITERDKVLAEFERDTRIGVARELANVRTPNFMISGGSQGGGSTLEQLLNVFMMRQMGVFDPTVNEPQRIGRQVIPEKQ